MAGSLRSAAVEFFRASTSSAKSGPCCWSPRETSSTSWLRPRTKKSSNDGAGLRMSPG
jgi:hypothetical protein